MNMHVSAYVRQHGMPGPGDFGPPEDTDGELRLEYEQERQDDDETLVNDLWQALDRICDDADESERLRYYLRSHDDDAALGLMLRVAVSESAEAYVEGHFAELKRMGGK